MSRQSFLVLGEAAEVTLDLESVPELVRLAEESAEANGHGGRNRPFAENDLIDCPWGNADRTGHSVL